jgi:hypothetical protein
LTLSAGCEKQLPPLGWVCQACIVAKWDEPAVLARDIEPEVLIDWRYRLAQRDSCASTLSSELIGHAVFHIASRPVIVPVLLRHFFIKEDIAQVKFLWRVIGSTSVFPGRVRVEPNSGIPAQVGWSIIL